MTRPTGEYAKRNRERFHLGVQPWLEDCKARLTFLTTESIVSFVLIHVYEQSSTKLRVLDLHPPCGLFPIDVSLMIDKRAAADRPGSPMVTSLAQELLAANPNAVVIGDGIDGPDSRVMNFQRVKGLNGLEHNDICIIPTFLAADAYAALNIVGQWLNLSNVITCFYGDQISQAVGRNQGFRKTDNGSLAVICSHRLKRNVLRNCFQQPSARIRLTQIEPPKRKAA
jgi:hypothetical protein